MYLHINWWRSSALFRTGGIMLRGSGLVGSYTQKHSATLATDNRHRYRAERERE